MKMSAMAWSVSLAGVISLGILKLAPLPVAYSTPEALPTTEALPLDLEDVTSSGRRLRLTLTLSAPDDLKVAQGDVVTQGQILSDRTRQRERLEAQRSQFQLQIDRLQQPIPGPPPLRAIPEVAALPPPTFLSQVAAVEQAKLKVKEADRAVMQQQRMLDLLQSMPSSQLPQATLPHEQEILAQLQQKAEQARADQDLAEARLHQAQSDRQYQEYLHSLELSKRSLQLQQQELERQNQLQRQQVEERNRSYQLADLEARLHQIDAQLLTLASVRSPFHGTIQRIKWQGQNDQNLVVELVLLAHPSGATAPGASPVLEDGDSPRNVGTTVPNGIDE